MSYQLISYAFEDIQFIQDDIEKLLKYNIEDEEELEQEQEKIQTRIQQIEEQINDQKLKEVFPELLKLRNDFFTQKISTKIIVCLIHIASTLKSQELAEQVFNLLTSESEKDSAQTKFNLMGVLFRSFNVDQKVQVNLFNKFLAHLKSQNLAQQLQQSIKNIDNLLNQWNQNSSARRQVYKQLIEFLGDSKQFQNLRQELIIKYIQAFEKEQISQEEIQTLQNYFVALLNQSNIKLIPSEIYYSNAFSQISQKKLPIATLLEYFITGDLQSYLNYESKNKAEIEKLGLNQQQLSQFIRIKAIPQIVESGSQIQFSQLAKQLQVSEQEVEQWVVLAIQHQLIEAQIDQFNSSVNVVSNDNRFFGKQDWQNLNNQLLDTIKRLQQLN